MKRKPAGFIVVYDDGQGLCCPMGDDAACPGAICCDSGRVTMFGSRSAARSAINISRAFARLRQTQGQPVNDDFTTGIKHVRVVSVVRA